MVRRSFFEKVVLVALLVSIGFGFLKQIKIAWRSVGAVTSPHHEAPGFFYSPLRDVISDFSGSRLLTHRFSYLSDRKHGTSGRPPAEFYYDFQYALAPLLVEYQGDDADYYFLDFTEEKAMEETCRDNRLSIIFRSGSLGIAIPAPKAS